MTQAAALDLQFNEGFSKQVQATYDAVPEGDTISDALWEEMVSEAERYLETLSQEERKTMAGTVYRIGVCSGRTPRPCDGPDGRLRSALGVPRRFDRVGDDETGRGARGGAAVDPGLGTAVRRPLDRADDQAQ